MRGKFKLILKKEEETEFLRTLKKFEDNHFLIDLFCFNSHLQRRRSFQWIDATSPSHHFFSKLFWFFFQFSFSCGLKKISKKRPVRKRILKFAFFRVIETISSRQAQRQPKTNFSHVLLTLWIQYEHWVHTVPIVYQIKSL